MAVIAPECYSTGSTYGTSLTYNSGVLASGVNRFMLIGFTLDSVASEGRITVTVGGKNAFYINGGANSGGSCYNFLFGFWVPNGWSGAKSIVITPRTSNATIQSANATFPGVKRLRYSGDGGNTNSLSVTWCRNGDTVVDFLAGSGGGSYTSLTPGASQTKICEDKARPGIAMSYALSSGTSITMSWTLNPSTKSTINAVALEPDDLLHPTAPVLRSTAFPQAVANGGRDITGTSYTVNSVSTLGCRSSKSKLVACIGIHGSSGDFSGFACTATIEGVGYSMTKVVEAIKSSSSRTAVVMFTLNNPPAGDATLAFSWTGSADDGIIEWSLWDYADTLIRDNDNSSGDTSNAIALTSTTIASDVCIDFFHGYGALRNPASGQTQVDSGAAAWSEYHRHTWKVATTTSTTMQMDAGSSTAYAYTSLVLTLAPPDIGANPVSISPYMMV
jgi:hypothetical protein